MLNANNKQLGIKKIAENGASIITANSSPLTANNSKDITNKAH